MQIYVCGPMQGVPFFNYPLFKATTELLRAAGHEVFNPAEADIKRHGVDISANNPTGDIKLLEKTYHFNLRQALYEDCEFICKYAEAVAHLPGWERSKGAQVEHALAVALGLDFIYINTNGHGEPLLPAKLLNGHR